MTPVSMTTALDLPWKLTFSSLLSRSLISSSLCWSCCLEGGQEDKEMEEEKGSAMTGVSQCSKGNGSCA